MTGLARHLTPSGVAISGKNFLFWKRFSPMGRWAPLGTRRLEKALVRGAAPEAVPPTLRLLPVVLGILVLFILRRFGFAK